MARRYEIEMRQLCFALCIGLGAGGMAPPAAAQGLDADSCRATRAIVSAAIKGRKAGATPQAIGARLGSDEGGVDARYRPTVPPLVDLVYKLDPSLLSEATADQFESICLSREGE